MKTDIKGTADENEYSREIGNGKETHTERAPVVSDYLLTSLHSCTQGRKRDDKGFLLIPSFCTK